MNKVRILEYCERIILRNYLSNESNQCKVKVLIKAFKRSIEIVINKTRPEKFAIMHEDYARLLLNYDNARPHTV